MATTYQEMLDEIKDFKPWRGPALATGVPGHLHGPALVTCVSGNNNGETRIVRVDCLCGAKLRYSEFSAPSSQPAPAVWASFEAFKKHLKERQAEAEPTVCESMGRVQRALDALTHLSDTPPTPAEQRMEVEYRDSRANTR